MSPGTFHQDDATFVPVPGSQLPGTTTNDDANAGNVGEYVTASLALGSATPLVTATPKTVASIPLTSGDWDVWGSVGFTGGGTTAVLAIQGSLSATNNVLDTSDTRNFLHYLNNETVFNGVSLIQDPVGPSRFTLSVSATVYLVALASFTTSTMNAYGTIAARRRR